MTKPLNGNSRLAKWVGVGVAMAVILAGVIGSYAVNSYRLDEVEIVAEDNTEKIDKVEKAIISIDENIKFIREKFDD